MSICKQRAKLEDSGGLSYLVYISENMHLVHYKTKVAKKRKQNKSLSGKSEESFLENQRLN